MIITKTWLLELMPPIRVAAVLWSALAICSCLNAQSASGDNLFIRTGDSARIYLALDKVAAPVSPSKDYRLSVELQKTDLHTTTSAFTIRAFLCGDALGPNTSTEDKRYITSFSLFSQTPDSGEPHRFKLPINAEQWSALTEPDGESFRCKNGQPLSASFVVSPFAEDNAMGQVEIKILDAHLEN